MSITTSGYFGLTLEKQLIDTAGFTLEDASNNWVLLVSDGYTPNFTTHDFEADVTNEIANGNGYTTGGQTLASAALTLETIAGEELKFDTADPQWAASTITSAMAAVIYDSTGTDTTDALVMVADFGTAVSTSNGTLTVQVATNGWFYITFRA